MNDRQTSSKPRLALRAGWLCAGLAMAAGVFCACGFDPAAQVARADEISGHQFADASSGHARVDRDADDAESGRVEQAHLKVDSRVAAKPAIRQMAFWPFSWKPAIKSSDEALLQKNLAALKRNSPRDPFAEAAEAAPPPNVPMSRGRPLPASIAARIKTANITSNRRRLLDYQSQGSKSGETSNADPVIENADASTQPSHSVALKAIPSSIPNGQANETATEAQVRAMFEQSIDATSEDVAETLAEAQTTLPATVEQTPVQNVIRQVDEAHAAEAEVVVSESPNQQTLLPIEALLYRSRNVRLDRRAESARQISLAAQKHSPAVLEQQPAPSAVNAPTTAGAATDGVIRTTHKSTLPEPQVATNRPLELPAPEGWSAATKLNAARRTAQSMLPAADTRGHLADRQLMANRDDAISLRGQPPIDVVQSIAQPVVLDTIEQSGSVRLLNAETLGSGDLQDAGYAQELDAAQREPAKIAELNDEPTIIPQLAAESRPPWMMYAIAAGGVLFGLFGMWRAGAVKTSAAGHSR